MFTDSPKQDYAVLNYLHSQIMIGARPGTWGQRDPKLTRAALARPYRSAFGQELYGDIYLKAAALLDAIINNVVFRDGNKRTGLAAATLFLALNERVLTYGEQDAEWFTYQIVVTRPEISEIADWLRQHTKQPHLQ